MEHADRDEPDEGERAADDLPFGGRDVLGEIGARAGLPVEVVDALTGWLAVQAETERFAQLERAGHSIEERIPLARVFVDLVATSTAGDLGAQRGEAGPFLAFLNQPAAVRRQPRRAGRRDSGALGPETEGDADGARVDGHALIGGPGQGKSTLGQLLCQLHRAWLLRPRIDRLADPHQREAVEAFTDAQAGKDLGRPAELRFPLRIPLAEAASWLSRRGGAADEPGVPALLGYVKERGGCPLEPADLSRLLGAGDWLLVLDGLDEVPPSADRARLLDAARELVQHLLAGGRDGLLLSTTRPQGYAGELDEVGVRLRPRHLVRFDADQALRYARRLVEARFLPSRREKVLERLEQAAAADTTARLMETPLQVTILATLVDRIGRAPTEQWTLFREYYRVVYEREMERPFEAAEILRLYRRYVDRIHAHVGLLLQVDAERAGGTEAALGRDRFRRVVEAALAADEIDGEKREELVDRLDRALCDRLVLLVERGHDALGFEIRSIQEFMAAWALSQKREEVVEARIGQIAGASAFRNVLLFLASKAFTDADAGELRDAFTDRVCPALNEAPDDPLSRAARAGSELALQILEEGSGLKQDKYVRKLATLACGLLDMSPPERQERLVLALSKDDDARQVAAPILEGATASRLEGEDPAGRLGAWMALLTQVACGDARAEGLAQAAWARLEPAEMVEVVKAAGEVGTTPWLLGKMWEAPRAFSPTWLFEVGEPVGIGPPDAYAGLFSALLGLMPDGVGRIILPVELDGLPTSLTVRLVSVVNSSAPAMGPLAEMADPPPDWLPWVVGARFARAPTARSLADGLLALAEIPLETARSQSVFRWELELAWPLRACLVRASSADDLRRMAAQAIAGELGDLEGWLAAEGRWRCRKAADLREVLSAARRLWDGIPPPLIAHGGTSSGATTGWLAGVREELARTSSEGLRELLGALLVSGERFVRLSPAEARALSAPQIARLPLSMLALREGDAGEWAEVLDERGRKGHVEQVRLASRAALNGLDDLYRAHPHRMGILSVRWAATFPRIAFLFDWRVDPTGLVTSIPRRLLDLSSLDEPRARASAAGFLLAQFPLTSAEITDVALALAQAPGDFPLPLVHVLRVRAELVGADQHEAILLALREHAPPRAWRLRREIDQAIRAQLAQRRSHLDEAAVWDRLHLPLPRPERNGPVSQPPFSEPPRVQVESITLQNLRAFADLSLAPTAPPADAGQWIVLLGENGTGKTTLLRSLVFALVDVTSQPNRLPRSTFDTPWRRRGLGDDVEASVKVSLNGVSFGAAVRGDPDRAGKERLVQGTSFPAAPVFAYGCRRGSALGGASRKVDVEPGAEVPTLFDEGADLVHAETWLLLREGAALREQGEDGPATRVYRAVIAALCSLLPGVDAIETRHDRVWVRGPEIGEVLLEALSDGYLTTMGWVVDLVARWVKRAELRDAPIPPDFTKTMTGLVLLDEIDLHLHPEWQRRVIQDVRRIFPRMSFIVTTHNPLSLLGAQAEEIWRLVRDERGHIGAEQGTERPELMTSSEIYGSYFGIQSLFPSDLGEMLDRYGFLARDPVRSDEEDAEMQRLRATLRDRGVDPGVEPVERESIPPYAESPSP